MHPGFQHLLHDLRDECPTLDVSSPYYRHFVAELRCHLPRLHRHPLPYSRQDWDGLRIHPPESRSAIAQAF